jgi:hypothetical protein
MIAGILRILFYLALGPFVAMIAGNLAIGATTLLSTGSTHDFVFDATLFAPQNLLISYTLGAGPALLTGVVALLLMRAYTGWRYWLWIAFAGASLSMALAWIVFGLGPLATGINPFIFSGVIAFAGGAAGFVCALLFDVISSALRQRA